MKNKYAGGHIVKFFKLYSKLDNYLVVFGAVYTRYCGLGGLYGPDKTSFILISIMSIPVNLTVASIKLLMAHIGSGRNATIVISFWPQKKNLLFR